MEWRNAIGLNGLTVVGDFLDKTKGLDITEARQEAASELLDANRYIYVEIRETRVNGEPKVSKTNNVVLCACAVLEAIQVKCRGRYRGPLVVQTVAQCWLDFEGFANVPGYVNRHDFPLAALILSATAVGSTGIVHAVLDILTTFRYITRSGSGPMDILRRRATMPQSQPGAAVSSK